MESPIVPDTKEIDRPEIYGEDPFVTRDAEGNYYLIESDKETVLQVRQSPTLIGLFQEKNKPTTIFEPSEVSRSKQVWAPELHHIGEKWYVYYAASDGNNENHRMYVLEGETPTGPFVDKGVVGDPEYDTWAIDGTVLQMPDGKLYWIWSGWSREEAGDPQYAVKNIVRPDQVVPMMSGTDQRQHLFIAEMESPTKIKSGTTMLLSSPDQAWEGAVEEGPQVRYLKDGNIQIVYSANASWTTDYCQGSLTLLPNSDPMQMSSWEKSDTYLFGRSNIGHVSFVDDEAGNEVLVYHKKTASELGWSDRKITFEVISQ